LCFEIAPFVFEGIAVGVEKAEKLTDISSVCLVVAPLVSLMKDQVAGLKSRGIAAAIIGPESTAAEIKDIRLGRFNLLFGSPEALLNSPRTVIRNLRFLHLHKKVLVFLRFRPFLLTSDLGFQLVLCQHYLLFLKVLCSCLSTNGR